MIDFRQTAFNWRWMKPFGRFSQRKCSFSVLPAFLLQFSYQVSYILYEYKYNNEFKQLLSTSTNKVDVCQTALIVFEIYFGCEKWYVKSVN